MDVMPDPNADESIAEETPQEFSSLHQLRCGRNLPPLLVGRAGSDDGLLNESIDAFVMLALEQNLEIDVLNHPTGEHGFDVRNNCRRSRDLIEATLTFFRRHL